MAASGEGREAQRDDATQNVFVTAPDGLRLHVEEHGPRGAARLPVVCLPGLARTSADFATLAHALATDAKGPRRVLALDYRGRGRSEYDSDPDNYTLPTELADLIAVLTARSVHRAVFVGTSRGGILAMLLAAAQPTRIAGVVLNDIGPVIEPIGLMRIKGYVGRLPQPASLEDGADILKRLFAGQFPKLTREDWVAAAARTWTRRDDGTLALAYDPKLARTLDGVDFERPIPPLWPQFDALARVPMLLIRGELTDLLSPQTAAAMRARRRKLDVIEVPDQGHPPALESPALVARIADFARACDKAAGAG
jgi:pimeloyl-ACP methyl ester carboxylesterase